MKDIEEALEEVEVLIDMHFFNKFLWTKSLELFGKVVNNQNAVNVRDFKIWRSLNCSVETLKVIRGQKTTSCGLANGRSSSQRRGLSQSWCSKARLKLIDKNNVSCCRKVVHEIDARHDIVVNSILNNILIRRGLVSHEQKWEDRKTVKRAKDEITV